LSEESATAICRHDACGRRFILSRYGNRTSTSQRRLKHHGFCSPKCRVAHHRRIKRLGALQGARGTIPKGCVTALEIIQQKQEPLTPEKTTEHPHSAPREWLRVYFEDEVPAIGSGLRLIAVDKVTPKRIHIRDHAGRTAKLAVTTYAKLGPTAFGYSAAMDHCGWSVEDEAINVYASNSNP